MMRFFKYEVFGNSFVLLWNEKELTDKQVRQLCDYRKGIGADGVLLLEDGDPPKIRIWNADGSEAKTSGNGLMCAAQFLFEQTSRKNIILDTLSGRKLLHREDNRWALDWGPISRRPLLTLKFPSLRCTHQVFNSFPGNDHVVWVFKSKPTPEEKMRRLEMDSKHFYNHEFVWRSGTAWWDVWVYERGVGVTRACGSGAASAAHTLYFTGLEEFPMYLNFKGGLYKADQVTNRLYIWASASKIGEGKLYF